jgi:hypothetical protein
MPANLQQNKYAQEKTCMYSEIYKWLIFIDLQCNRAHLQFREQIIKPIYTVLTKIGKGCEEETKEILVMQIDENLSWK